MRELNELKTEIFHRSQKRIIARKKAVKNTLVTCVSLLLVVGVCTFVALPKIANNLDKENYTDGSVGMLDEGLAEDLCDPEYDNIEPTEQQVTNSTGQSSSNFKKQQISYTYSVISQMFYISTDDGEFSNDKKEQAQDSDVLKSDSGIVITFIMSDDSKRVFELNDNILFDVNHNQKITLTSEQLEKIKVILELS